MSLERLPEPAVSAHCFPCGELCCVSIRCLRAAWKTSLGLLCSPAFVNASICEFSFGI